jgi:hypothetical protein
MTLHRVVVSMTLPAFLLGIAACSDPAAPRLTVPDASFNVNGASFVTTGGAEITLIVDGFTERWSFNAKGTPAKGQFNAVFRLFGQTIHVHGDIVCYNVDANRARLGGHVTSSSAPGLVGTEAIWSVEDNGEGSNALVADRATPYQTALDAVEAQAYCNVPAVPDPEAFPIETGNVQVHE